MESILHLTSDDPFAAALELIIGGAILGGGLVGLAWWTWWICGSEVWTRDVHR